MSNFILFLQPSIKNQPKISNFCVPSNPFDKKSPSKQLKISNFFSKAAEKKTKEENVNLNKTLENVSDSPDCVPSTPDSLKKRKRNFEPTCRRKLVKLDRYNKLLYDPTDDDNHCPKLESSTGKQDSCKTKEPIPKKLPDMTKKSTLKLPLQESNKTKDTKSNKEDSKNSQSEVRQKSLFPGNLPESSVKFHSRAEKIFSNVVKSDEGKCERAALNTKNEYNLKKVISNGKLSREHINEATVAVSKFNGKNTGNSQEFLSTGKSEPESKNNHPSTLKPTASLLTNDNFLDELLGELDKKGNVKPIENVKQDLLRNSNDESIHHPSVRVKDMKQSSCELDIVHNNTSQNLVHFAQDKDSYPALKNNTLSTEMSENSLILEGDGFSSGKVKTNSLENIISLSQNVMAEDEISTVENKSNNISKTSCSPKKSVPVNSNKNCSASKARLENNEDSVSSFLKLYGVQIPETVEEKISPKKLQPTISAPLTPEKPVEVSCISQEVAAVLSATKLPHASSPENKFNANLSSISKINFDDEDEEWNFSPVDKIE